VRCPPGTRIEQTQEYFAQVQDAIGKIIPKRELGTMLDNMGIPNSGLNLSLSEGALISPSDGQISIALKEDHAPTADYVRKLRTKLRQTYPESTFFFLAPDISTQVLNFGLAAPIDVQLIGVPGKEDDTLKVARQILNEVKAIPGAVDVHVHQIMNQPALRLEVDRTRAAELGVTQQEVAQNFLISSSSSVVVTPNYWNDPKTGRPYQVVVVQPHHTALDRRSFVHQHGIE